MKTTRRLLSLIVLPTLSIALSCNWTSNALNKEQKHLGSITAIRDMSQTRAAHTATLLLDGNVLVAGGFGNGGSGVASAEIFDPTNESFSSAGNMNVARAGHTATVLPNGKVFIAGGYNGNYLASAELYDPAAQKFTPISTMPRARSGHVAVLLRNGKVLLAGGVGVGWTFLRSADLYDPATNSFTTTGNMLAERESHTATLLNDGKVLIAGGHKGRRSEMTIYSSAEIYDPATGGFSATGDMTRIRHKHEAVLLTDGQVLIIGGADERDGQPAYSSVEMYDPSTKTFAAKGEMNSPRYKLQGSVVRLSDGKVLIAGGANRAEVFDPSTNRFTYVAGDMGTTRLFATATRLGNNKVLITGGYDSGNQVSAQAWVYST